MRLILGISLLLAGLGMLSCRYEVPQTHRVAKPVAHQWVRTIDGWQRPDRWQTVQARPPQLHPLVVASAQALVSMLALVACQRADV